MTEEQELTADKARQLLSAEKKQRESECIDAIQAACQQYRCRLHIVQILIDGKPQGDPQIRAEAIE